jgi:formylglycine-generating enzyme required for sulfatase activity
VAAPSTPSGRTGSVIVAALLAIAALGWGIARTPAAVSSAEAGPPPEAVEALPGFRSDAWYLPDDETLGFAEVPEGLFLMGSDPADTLAFDNEHWKDGTGPASVQVPTFYIGRFEVTVAQLRAFVDATGYRASAEAVRAPPGHPAVSVSWTDALAYARWLEEVMKESASTPPGIAQLLREGWHVTLPTEAQWEKAARGTDGRIYPWGNELRTDRANFQSAGTTPVGSFACPECPYGLSDMSGNAWEWTRTPFRDGPHDPSDQRVDLERDALWVMRGGSFGDPARNVRAALRGGGDPGVRRPFIGFRLVLSR